ncbi:hypothetical protein BX661DRAFT_201781 [Kickxella alabastrina]|uniref:uncharacterized protein n=1 Tax=Kickxella alabastrina TaxID=61397 RepID=UPI0022204ED5|nr:uncharacterized protein BX661DRAFT_201781 [Kickxella alabastrina]KAI7818757.1 hypothetical protein BX661DRAFT_201781 [Kickxella alabastrina]
MYAIKYSSFRDQGRRGMANTHRLWSPQRDDRVCGSSGGDGDSDPPEWPASIAFLPNDNLFWTPMVSMVAMVVGMARWVHWSADSRLVVRTATASNSGYGHQCIEPNCREIRLPLPLTKQSAEQLLLTDIVSYADELPRWDYAAGQRLLGLTRRRAAEVSLFNTV